MAKNLGSWAIFQPISMSVSLKDPMRTLLHELWGVLFEEGLIAPYFLSTLLAFGACNAWVYCLHVRSKECLRTANATGNHRGAMRGLPLFFSPCLVGSGLLKRVTKKCFKDSIHTFN